MTSSTDRSQWFGWAVDRPKSAGVLLSVLLLATAWLLPRAVIDFSLEQLYPQDSELAQFYKDHKAEFGPDDDLIFAARQKRARCSGRAAVRTVGW